MSKKQAEKFANNKNTKFAKLVKKLCIKHCSFVSNNPNFNNYLANMYTFRVLFAYCYSLSTPSIANNTHHQAYFLKIMRRNSDNLVAVANTPTNFMPK